VVAGVRQIDFGDTDGSLVLFAVLNVGANVFFFVVAWVVGDVARHAKERGAQLAQRNEQLQRARAVIEEQAILDERVRIARESTMWSPIM
jgi:signal transduction histidine kinase